MTIKVEYLNNIEYEKRPGVYLMARFDVGDGCSIELWSRRCRDARRFLLANLAACGFRGVVLFPRGKRRYVIA